MNSNYKVKQITRLYDSCNQCGLPIINCICSKASKIKTEAVIWILSTEKEFYRPSNTARLLKLANPDSTEIFLWKREKVNEKLKEYLNSAEYEAYLLFPVEDKENMITDVVHHNTEKTKAFIIIDGTWKEARKIFRKSSYLRALPMISLEPNFKSQYDLRRGAEEGNLCTIEAAIEILRLKGEVENSQELKEFYNLFLMDMRS